MFPVLEAKTKEAFRYFLHLCSTVPGIDVQRVAIEAQMALHRLRAKETNSSLLERWQKSLINDEPDWSIYGDDVYLGELWACWHFYSRRYLLTIIDPDRGLNGFSMLYDMRPVGSLVDLGCGFGFTTTAWKTLLPRANVFATNLPGISQTLIAENLGRERGFCVIPGIENIISPVDVVFASEYFEHVLTPLAHLQEMLDVLQPRCLLIANAFGTVSPGHFNFYQGIDRLVPAKEMNPLFNRLLRKNGYVLLKTKAWNQRPAYWKRMF